MPRPRIAPAASLSRLGSAAFIAAALASTAAADGRCVDLNSAGVEELREIIHIDEERGPRIVAERPWRSVRDLTDLRGIGDRRLADILDQGLACVGGDTGQRQPDERQ